MWSFYPCHFSVNELEAIRTAIQADRSLGRLRVTPITVANGRTIRLASVGISNTGEAFANSSSLHLKWELSGCDGLAYWDDTRDPKGAKYSWERFLRLQNESGLVRQDFWCFVFLFLSAQSFVLLFFHMRMSYPFFLVIGYMINERVFLFIKRKKEKNICMEYLSENIIFSICAFYGIKFY